MLLSEYLKLRNDLVVQKPTFTPSVDTPKTTQNNPTDGTEKTFAQALKEQIQQKSGVDFSSHAIKRIQSRNIDLNQSEKLERLNKGVELAAEKGSNEALVLVDSTAFVVSVKNNTVITTLDKEDLVGTIFTNIDAAVII